jgi:hypothetical protein
MQDFFHPPYDRWICILVVRRVPHSWVNPVAPIPRGPPALAFGNSGAANVNLHLGNNTLTYRPLRGKGKHRVNIDMTLYTVALWRFSNFKLSSWGISILAFELIPMKGHKRSAGGSAWSVAWKVNGKIRNSIRFHSWICDRESGALNSDDHYTQCVFPWFFPKLNHHRILRLWLTTRQILACTLEAFQSCSHSCPQPLAALLAHRFSVNYCRSVSFSGESSLFESCLWWL